MLLLPSQYFLFLHFQTAHSFIVNMADLGIPGLAYQPSGNTTHYGMGKSTPVVINQNEIRGAGLVDPERHNEFWRPGIRAQFPWVGFGAVCLMLGCLGTTVAILVTSDNKAQEQWPSKSAIYTALQMLM
jgi:hypothetical protein